MTTQYYLTLDSYLVILRHDSLGYEIVLHFGVCVCGGAFKLLTKARFGVFALFVSLVRIGK